MRLSSKMLSIRHGFLMSLPFKRLGGPNLSCAGDLVIDQTAEVVGVPHRSFLGEACKSHTHESSPLHHILM